MPDFDPLLQRYPSQRFPLYAAGGMVNCSVPQASAAGLEALRAGGNAMDAAVAAAAALTVTEPTANGLGSDAFAIIWSEKDKKLYGLNASGPSPAMASASLLLEEGKDDCGKMPKYGWMPVTVPGAPAAWAAVTKRFGKRSLADNLSPAIRYAKNGYPAGANLARSWQNAYNIYRKRLSGPCFDAWFDTFAPEGRTPSAGDLVTLPDHAETLAAIAETDARAFYEGDLAKKADAESRKMGGYLRYEDLASYKPIWVEPIRVNYRGVDVCEIPPNGQGIAALMALNILKEFSFTDRDDPLTLHRQIEAMKIAYADAKYYVTDPEYMRVDYHDLILPEYGAARAAEIGDTAELRSPDTPPSSGTVYLCCADSEGNMVSFIQSNYGGFGSGIVIPGTGIALQNRGADFSLDPEAANVLAGGKRSYHTIIPGFLMKDGLPLGPFGVMGGYMQPQGHVQVVMNMVDFHLDPQQALDAPRWQWMKGNEVTVETRFDANLAQALQRRGHRISVDLDTSSFGRGQIILRLPNGVYAGGCESRTDSNIALF
ncbi:MAG: gamma-glutamyltransferase family protein [Eubacterium sp.]|nr:gamma-glutamyltransferase family protein [Eubacterium sp.]